MFLKTKETLFALFSLSLVVSYIACCGYYFYFHLDISSFLTAEDLIFIITRWIWISILFLLVVAGLIKKIGDRLDSFSKAENWWNKPINRYGFKKGIYILLLLLILFIVCLVYFKTFRNFTLTAFGIFGVIVLLLAALFAAIETFTEKKSEHLNLNDWALICSIAFIFVYGVPFVTGMAAAENLPLSQIKITFEDGVVINTRDSADLKYIGKTHNYIFLYKPSNKQCSSYRIEKVRVMEIDDETIKRRN